jgi:hypothetical protein
MGSHAITYAVVALAIAAICLFSGFQWGRSNVRAQIEQAVEKEHVSLDAREFAMRTQLEDAIAEVAKLRPLAEELGRVQKRLEREQAKYAQMKAEFNASMGIQAEPSPQESLDTDAEPAQTRESADEAIQKLLQSLEVLNNPDVPAQTESLVARDTAPPSQPPSSAAPASPVPAPTRQVPVVPSPASAAQPAGIALPPRSASAPKPAETARPVPPVRPAAPAPARAPSPAAHPPAKAVTPAPAPSRSPAPAPAKAAPPPPRMPAPNTPGKPAPDMPSRPAPKDAAKPGQHVDEWQEFARQLEALTGKKK